MTDTKLNEAKDLKERATALRKRGQLDRALSVLDQAIQLLTQLRLEADTTEVRAELADTYGMIGGVRRRQHEPKAALEAYREGRKFEEIDKESTYNLSNEITLSISTEGISPTDSKMQQDLEAAIMRLTLETQGPRKDEWWAWSDLAQFYVLAGKLKEARNCYNEALTKTGATMDEIKRHVTILEELAQGISAKAPNISNNLRTIVASLT